MYSLGWGIRLFIFEHKFNNFRQLIGYFYDCFLFRHPSGVGHIEVRQVCVPADGPPGTLGEHVSENLVSASRNAAVGTVGSGLVCIRDQPNEGAEGLGRFEVGQVPTFEQQRDGREATHSGHGSQQGVVVAVSVGPHQLGKPPVDGLMLVHCRHQAFAHQFQSLACGVV